MSERDTISEYFRRLQRAEDAEWLWRAKLYQHSVDKTEEPATPAAGASAGIFGARTR